MIMYLSGETLQGNVAHGISAINKVSPTFFVQRLLLGVPMMSWRPVVTGRRRHNSLADNRRSHKILLPMGPKFVRPKAQILLTVLVAGR